MANEVRIFKHPEFLFSEQPTGYERDEDPFVYYNGGSRRPIVQKDKLKEDEDAKRNKPKRLGSGVMEKSLNLTDSVRIGDFCTNEAGEYSGFFEAKVSEIEVPIPKISKEEVDFDYDDVLKTAPVTAEDKNCESLP